MSHLGSKQSTNQQISGQLHQLMTARQSLQQSKDVSGSMVRLSKALTALSPLIQDQASNLKNFFSAQQSADPFSKESQTRRYFTRICELTLSQTHELLSCVGDLYFTLAEHQTWNKIITGLEKDLNAQRQAALQGGLPSLLFKCLNMKDTMFRQFLHSLIYRKCLLWKDMNLVGDGYVHAEKKKITMKLQQELSAKKYIPTRPVFESINLNGNGFWSLTKIQRSQCSVGQFLKIFNEDFKEMCMIMINYNNLIKGKEKEETQKEIADLITNKDQVKTLREDIEIAYMNYAVLQKKYRDALGRDERQDVVEMRRKLKSVEEELQEKQNQIKELKFQFRDSSSQLNALKQKNKELEADLQRINDIEMKKLKEMEILMVSLQSQFKKVHRQIKDFGNVFEFQSNSKQSLGKQISLLKNKMQQFAQVLGKEKRKNMNLTEQIKRLNQIIIELGYKLDPN